MEVETNGQITTLLEQIASGDKAARGELVQVTYDELHRLAAMLMRRERPGHTLQPTALLHEAVVKLCGTKGMKNIVSRALFFGSAARIMRHLLVDHARQRQSVRRGGDFRRIPLDDVVDQLERNQGIDLIALNEVLNRLEKRNKRQFDVVMLRFFVGQSVDDIAKDLGVSATTVKNDWNFARVWLCRQLGEDS